MLKAKQSALKEVATRLLKANNTVTTLEIKAELFVKYPDYYWDQQMVSDYMAQEFKGVDYTDNGTYRTYSFVNQPVNAPVIGKTPKTRVAPVPTPTAAPVPTPQPTSAPTKPSKVKTVAGLKGTGKTKYISRTNAAKMMANNHGHFFTAVFVDKKGEERLINCQYLKNQSGTDLGYIKVREASLVREARKVLATNPLAKAPSDIRNVNVQTLKAIKIGGELYKIR